MTPHWPEWARLTDREASFRIATGEDIPSPLLQYPRWVAINKEGQRMRKELANPALYWDRIIANAEERLCELREERECGTIPHWAQGTILDKDHLESLLVKELNEQ